MLKQALRLGWLGVGLLLSGCISTFEPRLYSSDLSKPRLPTAREVKAGVEVSMEEFASPSKSRRAFDAEVAANGVLPLLVHIENRGAEAYKVRRDQITASLDGQPLAPIAGYEAAEIGAARNPILPALVNTAALGPLGMYFGVFTLAASASHTQSVNRRIEQHFESLELTDMIVKPGETTAGFVFFKTPGSANRLDKLVVDLTLEADAPEEANGKQLRYRLSSPTLETPESGRSLAAGGNSGADN